jgi:hypothetical protein
MGTAKISTHCQYHQASGAEVVVVVVVVVLTAVVHTTGVNKIMGNHCQPPI